MFFLYVLDLFNACFLEMIIKSNEFIDKFDFQGRVTFPRICSQ